MIQTGSIKMVIASSGCQDVYKIETGIVRQAGHGSKSFKDEKKVSRNKMCPFGSMKKYEACCGAVAERASSKSIKPVITTGIGDSRSCNYFCSHHAFFDGASGSGMTIGALYLGQMTLIPFVSILEVHPLNKDVIIEQMLIINV
ncbi:hypothetical protein AKJ16_DCAP10276 [Drosera capensis]